MLSKVASTTNKRTQVWEVKLLRQGQRDFVKSLDTIGAVNIWKEEPSTMDIMVEAARTTKVAGLLHDQDIPYSIAVSDVDALWRRQRGLPSVVRKKSASSKCPAMDWLNYHRLESIYNFMDCLVKEFPYLASVHVIGRTFEGRDIKLLKISNGNADNVAVWLDGGIHAREWISPAVVAYVADQLVRNYQNFSSCITQKDWYILPVMNPDGYEYTHTMDRMWRKNRTRYGDCVGVDLNRNFSYAWGNKGEEGSSEDPGSVFYRGPEPFSEPETMAVKNAITKSDTTFKAFLSLHSYGEVVIFPWGHTSDPCPDYVQLLEGGTKIAKAIHSVNGHTYKVGSTKDLMYYSAGTSTDWAYGHAKITYSYMIELRGKQHRFLLPKDEIIPTAKEAWAGIQSLLEFIDRKDES